MYLKLSPGKWPKQTSLVLIQKISRNLGTIFGGQGGCGLPGPIPSTEVRTPKASFNRGTKSKCLHQFQNAIQCNKYQKYNPRPRYRYVPKIVSWKMAKANKLSF